MSQQDIVAQLTQFDYNEADIRKAMNKVEDDRDINSIMQYIDDCKDISETTEGTDFSGIWELVSSENLDSFMKSEGFGYILRKLIAAAPMTVTNTHDLDGNKMEIQTQLPVGKPIHDKLILNGKTVFKTVSPFGDNMEMISYWKDNDKQERVITEITNLKTKSIVTVERYLLNQNELFESMTNLNKIQMKRKYKRKK